MNSTFDNPNNLITRIGRITRQARYQFNKNPDFIVLGQKEGDELRDIGGPFLLYRHEGDGTDSVMGYKIVYSAEESQLGFGFDEGAFGP